MIEGMRVLAVVAARGGSKGLPRKNVLACGGKPLIAWTIEAGQASRHIDRLILSSDDQEAISVARDLGCEVPFVRPPELATDSASIHDALIHALDNVAGDYDLLVLLQATSPLRRAADIDAALELCVSAGAPSVLTLAPSPKPPYWMVELDPDGRMRPVIDLAGGEAAQRQAFPPTYVPNGAVYVARVEWYRRHRVFSSPDALGLVMPAERSVDVDYLTDLKLADLLLREGVPQ